MGKKKRNNTNPVPNEVDSLASTASEDEADSSAEASTLSRCPHVGKAVHLAGLKKALKTSWTRIGACAACAKENRGAAGVKASPPNPVDPAKPITIWMCLRCGSQLCDSNSSSNHFNKHLEVPRSDSHSLALNVMTWKIWCSECKNEVPVDSYKKVREAVDFVKKIEETKGRSDGKAKAQAQPKLVKTGSTTSSASSIASTSVIPKARGLSNLGNTCFFNSVMQSLCVSHPLIHVLDQQSQKGAPFQLPSVNVSDSVVVKEMSLQLGEGGAMTLALAAFFKEMNSLGKQGVYNPGHLFGQVCRKSPQFRGFHQQDAHELLRHLMDGLRSEEAKRQKSSILKEFGLSEKTDPKTVPEGIRKKLQALARHSNYTIVDKIFGGHLVSTIVCEQCHNSSQIYEPFLDISLPLVEEKPQRPHLGRKSRGSVSADEVDVSCFGKKQSDDGSVQSKSLSRKERVRLKKEKRRDRKRNKMSVEEDQDEEGIANNDDEEQKSMPDVGIQEQEEEDVNEEDDNEKVEDEPTEKTEVETCGAQTSNLMNRDVSVVEAASSFEKKNKKVEDATKPEVVDGNEEDDEDDGFDENDDDWEWDYEGEEGEQKDKNEEAEKDNQEEEDTESCYLEAPKDDEPEQLRPKPVSLNPLPPEVLAELCESRERSSEPGTCEAEEESDADGDVEDNLDETNPGSSQQVDTETSSHEPFCPDPQHLDPHMEQLCRKVRKMSIASVQVQSRDGGNFESSDSSKRDYILERESSDENDRHRLRLQNDWIARSLTSIAPRYQSTSGECSIYSCLTQFTAPELLTGNNKWACDRCTKLQAAVQADTTGEEGDDTENGDADAETVVKAKPKTVYSNASKQLLIYSPPAVLTIHLKRFQQTMTGLRKVNRPVDFPKILDLAPFCSSTSLSTATVNANTKEILYELYAIVQHSGRLSDGHYTAFVKARPADTSRRDFTDLYSSPTAKNEDIQNLLSEIERKCRIASENEKVQQPDKRKDGEVPSKWYFISDSHVSEVSEDKVMKCQAYILFYERIN